MIPGTRRTSSLLATFALSAGLLGGPGELAACGSSDSGAPGRQDAASDGAPEASPQSDAATPDAPTDAVAADSAREATGPAHDAATDAAPGACVALPTEDGGYPAVTTIVGALTRPSALAVDGDGLYVMTGGGAGSSSAALLRIGFDGGAPTTLASADAGAETIAIDTTWAYWVTSDINGVGSLLRTPLQGGPTAALAATNNGYAVAAYGSIVYFTDYYPTPGSLLAVALDGGAPVQTQTSQLLIVNDSVAASAAGEFWLAANNDGTGQVDVGQVWMAPPGGGGQGTLLATGQTAPKQIAVDDQNVYWTNQGDGVSIPGSVVKVPIQGGTPVTLATMCDLQSQPWAIAVADGQVYFTVEQMTTPWSIERVPAAGGPTTLMSVAAAPVWLALDANNVYFADVAAGVVGFVPR